MSIQADPAVLANLRDIDNRLPGSLKKAAAIYYLGEWLALQSSPALDVSPGLPIMRLLDDMLPGSMKDAALVYLMGQLASHPIALDSGIATLSNGSVVVPSASADAANPILLTYYSATTAGPILCYNSVIDGVSFKINSSNNSDAGKVAWSIMQP